MRLAALLAALALLCAAPVLAQTNDCPTPINGTLKGEAGNDQDNMFHSLAVDPVDENIVYVGTETNGIFKTTDRGVTWVRLRNGLKCTTVHTFYPEIYDIAVDPSNHNTVYAATVTGPGPASPVTFPSASAGIYKSTDGGQTWVQKNNGLPGTYTSGVLVDRNQPGRIYAVIGGALASYPTGMAAFYNGGLFVSENGGDSWSALTLPSGAERNIFISAVLAGTDQRTIYLTGQVHRDEAPQAYGFMRSGDSGQSWVVSNPSGETISHIDASRQDPLLLYANTESARRVRKSTDGGITWTSIGPAIFFGTFKIHPTDSRIVYYPGSPNGTIWRTVDGFDSVQQVYADTSLASGQIVSDIEIAPSNPNVIWVAVNGYYLYRSTDGGTSWAKITAVRDMVYGANNATASSDQPTTVTPVAFSGSSSRASYIRIVNPSSSAGSVQISVRDELGTLLGSYTRTVAALSAPQIAMAEIEAQANVIKPVRASAFAQVGVSGDFHGYVQHVTYDAATGILANASLCKPGSSPGDSDDQSRTSATNVHSTSLTTHPSKIALLSTESTPTAVTLLVYDAATGAALGQWTSPAVPALGTLLVPVAQIQQDLGLTPQASQFHLNFKLSGTAHVLLGHLVTNPGAGVDSDMTARCPF